MNDGFHMIMVGWKKCGSGYTAENLQIWEVEEMNIKMMRCMISG